jgi:fatty acid desaturase
MNIDSFLAFILMGAAVLQLPFVVSLKELSPKAYKSSILIVFLVLLSGFMVFTGALRSIVDSGNFPFFGRNDGTAAGFFILALLAVLIPFPALNFLSATRSKTSAPSRDVPSVLANGLPSNLQTDTAGDLSLELPDDLPAGEQIEASNDLPRDSAKAPAKSSLIPWMASAVICLAIILAFPILVWFEFGGILLLVALVWLLIVIPGYVVYQASIQRRATKD